MATRKQKQELIDTLKFTPIRARIYIQGYGGETYAGRVSREEYEAYKRGQVDIEQYANDWDDNGKWDDIPQELRIFSPGQPYDCDNLFHESGATMDDGSYVTVEDEHGNTIFESSLNITDLTSRGVNVALGDDVDTDDMEDGTVVYWGGQGEKGCFFDGEFTLRAPFDASKLTVFYSNCDGWLLSGGVEYDDEDIEGTDGYSTTGKWAEHKFYIVGGEEVYQGVERDEDGNIEEDDDEESPENDCSSEWDPVAELAKIDVPVLENEETWAQRVIDEETFEGIPYSPWFKDGEKPVRPGDYEVIENGSAWPFPYLAQWTGKVWKVNKKNVEVKQWRGLSRPAE